jgi:superfamily II DNA helicase RecQ
VRVVREEPRPGRSKRENRSETFSDAVSRVGPLHGDDIAGVDELFEALRALRREIADRDATPPYVVFHDATLREMATVRPSTEEEMLEIGGVGKRKLEKYGADFLRLTRR